MLIVFVKPLAQKINVFFVFLHERHVATACKKLPARIFDAIVHRFGDQRRAKVVSPARNQSRNGNFVQTISDLIRMKVSLRIILIWPPGFKIRALAADFLAAKRFRSIAGDFRTAVKLHEALICGQIFRTCEIARRFCLLDCFLISFAHSEAEDSVLERIRLLAPLASPSSM